MRKMLLMMMFVAFPCIALAAENSLSRAEGLSIIWEGIHRPVEETNETPFSDANADRPFGALITYAKARGVVEDGDRFYPDEPLRLIDGLVWLLRSRNVSTVEGTNADTLPRFLEQYPLLQNATMEIAENPILSGEDLRGLTEKLDTLLKEETHEVSYYGEEFAGDGTAFGEKFDPQGLTAAHRTLPYNTLVRVTNRDAGKSVTVRINDRGPYVDGRDMDLSLAAFEALSHRNAGVLRNVTFERIGDVGIIEESPTCTMRFQRRLGSVLLTPGIPATAAIGTTIELRGDRSFRVIQMRAPGAPPARSTAWTPRGEAFTITYEKEGVYSFVIHEDSGQRRRFRTKVSQGCM